VKPQPASRATHVLLTEGTTDEHVAGHLYRSKYNSDPPFSIRTPDSAAKLVTTEFEKQLRGAGGMLEVLPALIKTPGLKVLGVLIDADDPQEQHRWRDLRECLADVTIEVPKTPDPRGTIINIDTRLNDAPQLKRVGVWLAPDNESPGELEDLIATMARADDDAWPLAAEYIATVLSKVEGKDKHLIQRRRKTRATVWAWMATRREPVSVGAAIKNQDLDATGELCQRFIAWLENLYTDIIEPASG